MNSAFTLIPASVGPIYIVTLCSSTVPMPIRVPFVHQLEGFSVFRSHRVEDGRERFRLHVGYFDSLLRAREALPVIRDAFPGAWIELAPSANLGSLDDTLSTTFDSVRRANARLVGSRISNGCSSLEGQDSTNAVQRYIVQLEWSVRPIDISKVAQLPEIRGYDVYSVREGRDGQANFGVRLGFFKNIRVAERMAAQLASHFANCHALPISHREYSLAIECIYRRTSTLIAKLDSLDSESA